MIINCIRCGTQIDSPDARNADYVLADDIVDIEPRDVFMAVRRIEPAEGTGEEALERVEVADITDALADPDVVRIEVERRMVRVQKTGIVCPGCHRDTDFVIWGVHKVQEEPGEVTP